MPIQRHVLAELEFTHTHMIQMDGDMPEFQAVIELPDAASVYMWASPTDVPDEFEVLYVGKAGFGVKRRLRQHRGGFVNSGTGRKNRALLTEWIGSGRSVMVFARVSASHLVFGTEVSLYSTEEHALCDRFLPRWNRANFPRAADVPHLPPEQLHAVPVVPHLADPQVFNEAADGDETAAFYGALPAEKQIQFAQLIAFIERIDPAAGQKVVGEYADQPRGYNGKPMLVIGKISPSGTALTFVGRIPLVDDEDYPLTVIFPPSALAQGIDPDLVAVGKKGTWRPLSLANFLQNPNAYLR